MDRKSFSTVLDEAVGQLDQEVRALKNQQSTITMNLQELEKTRDGLSQEIIDLTAKRDAMIQKHKQDEESINKTVQDKYDQANDKNTEAAIKLSELNEKIKEYEDLTSSNIGLKKNLEIQTMEYQDKLSKMNMALKVIKEHLDIL